MTPPVGSLVTVHHIGDTLGEEFMDVVGWSTCLSTSEETPIYVRAGSYVVVLSYGHDECETLYAQLLSGDGDCWVNVRFVNFGEI